MYTTEHINPLKHNYEKRYAHFKNLPTLRQCDIHYMSLRDLRMLKNPSQCIRQSKELSYVYYVKRKLNRILDICKFLTAWGNNTPYLDKTKLYNWINVKAKCRLTRTSGNFWQKVYDTTMLFVILFHQINYYLPTAGLLISR